PPQSAHGGLRVADPVSLRDLPATVADVVGLAGRSPFPGRSLARYWLLPSPVRPEPVLAEVAGPVHSAPNQGRSPVFRGPMSAAIEGQRVYIHNGDGREELYDVRADAAQRRDLAALNLAQPVLEQLRGAWAKLMIGKETGSSAALSLRGSRPLE